MRPVGHHSSGTTGSSEEQANAMMDVLLAKSLAVGKVLGLRYKLEGKMFLCIGLCSSLWQAIYNVNSGFYDTVAHFNKSCMRSIIILRHT